MSLTLIKPSITKGTVEPAIENECSSPVPNSKTNPRLPADGSPLRLHLGCGLTRHEGWLNCDYIDTEYAECVFDVQKTWPFPDNSVHEIYASHMLEHLRDHDAFFNEAWRVLHPNGSLMVRLPHGHHRAAWWDVEHIRPWFPETFAYLQPGYAESIRNPQHSTRTAFFGIETIDQRVDGAYARLLRWKWGRKLLMPWLGSFNDALAELHGYLFAIKDEATKQAYLARNPGFSVPSRYVIYQHDLLGDIRGPNMPGGCVTVVLQDL
jgi:SAM-dependent methyltransferase